MAETMKVVLVKIRLICDTSPSLAHMTKKLDFLSQKYSSWNLISEVNRKTATSCIHSTLNKVQKIRVILRISENTFSLLQRSSMREQNLKHKKIKKTYITKIILHNYISNNGDPTYVGTFPVNSGMHLIFTDFQHST